MTFDIKSGKGFGWEILISEDESFNIVVSSNLLEVLKGDMDDDSEYFNGERIDEIKGAVSSIETISKFLGRNLAFDCSTFYSFVCSVDEICSKFLGDEKVELDVN